MKSISFEEKAKLTQVIFLSFLEQVYALEPQDCITIWLSGGTSLISFYGALLDSFPLFEPQLREKIRFVFLDERLVSFHNLESNYRFLSEILFTPLLEQNLISPEQIFTIQTDIADPAMEYTLRVPPIDIALFGVWPDGHIASLFPNHPGLEDTTDGFIMIHDSPKSPQDRISISIPYIHRIPSIFVFFMGESKGDAYERFIDPKISKKQCPVKYLLSCKKGRIITDLV